MNSFVKISAKKVEGPAPPPQEVSEIETSVAKVLVDGAPADKITQSQMQVLYEHKSLETCPIRCQKNNCALISG